MPTWTLLHSEQDFDETITAAPGCPQGPFQQRSNHKTSAWLSVLDCALGTPD
ncbi:hypothetical protein DPMN_137989 [Dreissena polymorpha]|uniref:Uncharacterized protein n=1 Tax=Dreissena polymorpha TaxID=45954 RepID=A0A9D4JF73_DREPO|nr:hypothetical protein DPMN_137989 [Dreissena polymorpha]